MIGRSIKLLAAASFLTSCALARPAPPRAPTPSDAALIEDGRMIAETQCAACHAIGRTGSSPHAQAPPLRRVLARYDEDSLTQDLNEGIRVGHPDMPQFQFPIRGVDALIAYLRSIRESDENGA